MKRIFILCWVAFLLSCSFCFVSFALEKPTHEKLNETIAPVINQPLTNIGFEGGVQDSVNGKKIIQWIMEGGIKEDEPMNTRSFNHFHNPLKTWDSAGFKGTFQSAILWAQDQGSFGSFFGGNYSWTAIREYFYIALTGKDFNGTIVAPTQIEKEKYFGYTFQGLGQIMHLVEDMSVPSHTRDDAHVIAYHYELAVDKLRKTEHPIFLNAIANPMTFDPSVFNSTPNPLAPIPIAKIFDTDQYNGSAPNVTAFNTIGLSEYVNANFVSEGLISANFQVFPYPRISDTQIVEKQYSGSFGTYMRQYYLKNCCGETNAGQGYLLSAVDYLDYWRKKFPLLSIGLSKIPVLDDNVYQDYTKLLIPRAVGYSAGLLNYFFRGEVEFNKEIYEQVTDEGITGLNLKVKNLTPNEEMKDGEVLVSYKYKPTGETEFTYGLSDPLASGNIPYESETFYDFTFPTPIPADATDVQYLWVFKGTLGQEVGAVIGKVTPDPCRITGEWLCKQDEGVSMTLTQEGNNITGSWTDLLVYCPPNDYVSCTATGTGTYDSTYREIDLIFNTDMYCCCPQLIYEGVLISCDCMSGRLRSVCNPSTDVTFTRKGSDALCFP